MIEEITGITVTYNTIHLIKPAYESVRKFHHEMRIIIIDGSDPHDPCREYVKSLASPYTTVGLAPNNIGHGRGMDYALRMVKTKYAIIFDSDIVMLKSPLEAMLAMMKEDTYAVGYNEITGKDGFEYGVHVHHVNETPTKYMHPYFMLIQVSEYFKFHTFVHHGAPCFLAMNEIKEKGLSEKILIDFPGLGHSAGKGWTWEGEVREFIKHDSAGTRKHRRSKGKNEIEGLWVYV
jgi:glycosyltransferase involved in cell wall biosynthesis